MKVWIGFCFLIMHSVWASMETNYQEGGSYISPLQENAKTTLSKSNLNEVPQFKSENPLETTLNKNGNFDDAINTTLDKSDAGKLVIETAKNRERFEINPNTDPLFQVQNEKTAEQILNIKNEPEAVQKEGFVEKNCEEGGEDITHECFENRHVTPKVPMKTATLTIHHALIQPRMINYQHQIREGSFWHHSKSETRQRQEGYTLTLPKDIKSFKNVFCPGFSPRDIKTTQTFNIDCGRVQSYTINNAGYKTTKTLNFFGFNFNVPLLPAFSLSDSGTHLTMVAPENFLNITLNHDTFEGEEIDEWHSTCDELEKMVDEGLCQYGERTLTQGPETRNINGYQIKKDAWQYKQIYHCKMIKDDCDPLRAEGCYQISSKCKEQKQDRCWIYEQTYQCPNGKLSSPKLKSPSSETFCLTGNCHNTSYQANSDMLEVISRLSLLKEIQNDIRGQGNSNFHIFKGKEQKCSRDCLSFKDCCGGLKGWGISLHIAGCSPTEKELAKMREQSLCHQIGTYCSKKIFGKCVTKKTGFCCFGSKFARLLQVQGRAQLGLGWGTAECPDCRGLTVQELSRIDLSKMNFRELFEDVMRKYKRPDLKSLQESTSQKINQNIQRIEQGLKQKKPMPNSGVLEGHKDGL